jgi:peptidoglycan/LPS O-acetylase OafA/YrhL
MSRWREFTAANNLRWPLPNVAGAAHPKEESMQAGAPGESAHVPALDGIRGVAILLVVIYHFASSMEFLGVKSPLLSPWDFGWGGVDVFFTLSGFLITGILLDTKASPGYFKAFYARRVLRIFPLYYGALFVVMILRAILPSAGIWGIQTGIFSPGSYFWTLLFLQNAAVAIHGSDASGVLTHYWSLGVEEYFYLLWPLLVWLLSRRLLGVVSAMAICASIVGRLLVLRHGLNTGFVFGLTPLRLDGLALGALAAILIRVHDPRRLRGGAVFVFTAAMAALIAMFWGRGTADQSDPLNWMVSYPAISVATAALLVLCCAGGMVAIVFSARILRWFGRYSYGLYVWHPITGMLLFHSAVSIVPRGAGAGLVTIIALGVFALDLVIAWASYQFWEKRFLRLKRYFPTDTQAAGPEWNAPPLSAEHGSLRTG